MRLIDKGNSRGYFTQTVTLVCSDNQKHVKCADFYKALSGKLSHELINLPIAEYLANKGKPVVRETSESDVIDFTDGGLSALELALSPSHSNSVETTREILQSALQQMSAWRDVEKVPFFRRSLLGGKRWLTMCSR